MAKVKTTAFFCEECGYESSKWMEQCPARKIWNSMVKEPVSRSANSRGGLGCLLSGSQKSPVPTAEPSLPPEVDIEEQDRISTGFGELDRVLGDGIMVGSLILVGGDSGVGKPTPLLQVCRNLAGAGQQVLRILGEESPKQTKVRANRIGLVTGEPKFLCGTSLEHIEGAIDTENPQIAVIDSIQTMYREEISSAPGSANQARESTGILVQIAKNCGIVTFVVGHVTEESVVTGPRVLEHMVDTVLCLEGDRNASYHTLRSMKSRLGSTNEIGVFEVQEQGLVGAENPSEYMLDSRPEEASGVVMSYSFESTRPILLEVQALVAETNFGMPRRTAAGTDYNYVNLLMVILEKHCRCGVSRLDVYVSIVGGIKANEPVLDLTIIMVLMSSYKDRSMDSKMLIFREVGLSGEVKVVPQAGQRVSEAARLGLATCMLSKVRADKMKQVEGVRLIGVPNVREAIGII